MLLHYGRHGTLPLAAQLPVGQPVAEDGPEAARAALVGRRGLGSRRRAKAATDGGTGQAKRLQAVLRHAVLAQLGSYATTAAEDRARLAEGTVQGALRDVLRVRLGEKLAVVALEERLLLQLGAAPPTTEPRGEL